MFLRPSKQQREKILENIENRNENLHRRWSEFTMEKAKARISPFLHVHNKGELVLLYHSLNLKKIIGGRGLRELYEHLKRLPCFDYHYARSRALYLGDADKVMNEFMARQFFHISGRDDHRIKEQWTASHAHRNFFVSSLFISLQGKDLPYCDYHLEIPDNKKNGPMDFSIVQEALERFERTMTPGRQAAAVILSTGENLLPERYLKDVLNIVDTFKSRRELKEKKVRIIYLTYAHLLNSSIIKVLGRFDPEVYLNLDPVDESDNSRQMSEELCEKYARLREKVTAVLPFLSLRRRNRDTVMDSLETISRRSLAEHLRILIDPGNVTSGNDAGADELSERYMEVFGWLRDHMIRETNIGHRIWAFVNEVPIISKCAVYGGQIAVNPAGVVGRCPHLLAGGIYEAGHSGEEGILEKILKYKNFDSIKKTLPLLRDECQECPALGLCGGGCRFRSHLLSGAADLFHCRFMKSLIKKLFDELLSQTGRTGNQDEYDAGKIC